MIVTPLDVTYDSFGRVSSQFPPPTAARSTTTLPGFMPATASLVMSRGERLPGMAAVVMAMSVSWSTLRNVSCCAFLKSSDISFA